MEGLSGVWEENGCFRVVSGWFLALEVHKEEASSGCLSVLVSCENSGSFLGFVLLSSLCLWVFTVVKGGVLLVLATGHGGMEVVGSWVAWVVLG